MKKYLILLTSLFVFSIIAEAQNDLTTQEYINKLDSLVEKENYKDAESYASLLKDNDYLSTQSIKNLASTLYAAEKFEDCLNFIFKWEKSKKEEDVFFNKIKAYCYLSTSNFEEAEKCLDNYHSLSEKKNVAPETLSFLGLGIAKSRMHKYKEAVSAFEIYLTNSAKEENTYVERLIYSNNKKKYGNAFYYCAYSYFYQGDEIKGDYYLNLAEKAGNENAKKDLFFLSKNPSYAKPLEIKNKYIRDYEQMLSAFSVYYDCPQNDRDEFWSFIKNSSPEMKELNQQYSRKKPQKTLRNAIRTLERGRDDITSALHKFNAYSVGQIENAVRFNLIETGSRITELKIYREDSPNAFATPYGQIYLTDGLVQRLNYDSDLLTAVCAHEMTHYVCEHSLMGLWATNKRNKRNKIWGGIAAGLAVGALAYADSYNNSYNNDGYNNNYNYNNYNAWIYAGLAEDIMLMFDMSTVNFSFKYDRKQELESDYVAYRFCEANGIGGYAYIMALELLGNDELSLKADKKSNHPTTNYRVQFLKYLYKLEHEEGFQPPKKVEEESEWEW